MFRFQDNVPEVYINESRDFQILSRLSDALFSGLKYDIDSIVNILDASLAKDRVLQLMCTKVGFFPKIEIDAQVLKYIIASFPYILKNKGNKLGIEYAVNAILKAENNPNTIEKPIIIINNTQDESRDPYTIYIYATTPIYNSAALKEVLRYVVPVGYTYKILAYSSPLSGYENPDLLKHGDIINVLKVNQKTTSIIRTPKAIDDTVAFTNENGTVALTGENNKVIYNANNRLANELIGAFDTTSIATPKSMDNIDTDIYEKVIMEEENS